MTREFASFGKELAQVEAKGRTLTGYASVFNYPIDSGAFGHKQTTFVRPGAFTQTLKQNRDQVQVLVNHGMDARWGMSPVATVKSMDQDAHGLRVEADIIDHPEFDPIVASLKAGAFRAMSIQFEVVKEDMSDDRAERNLREVKLWEFGPVTFPANAAAVASLHSLQEFAVTVERDSESDQAESSSVESRVSTLDTSRPTWWIELCRIDELRAAELAAETARMTK